MQRIALRERPDWRAQAERLGFAFHTFDGEPYWDESAAYRFSLRQIEEDLEAPTEELHAMSLALVEEVVASEALLERLGVPAFFREHLAASWRRREPHLYGRLDLAYDGQGPAKLLELNYDTPTALYEAAFFQWLWLEQLRLSGELPAAADQFNSIQECLFERFAGLAVQQPLYFASVRDSLEDRARSTTCATSPPRPAMTPATSPSRTSAWTVPAASSTWTSGTSPRCSSSTPGSSCWKRTSARASPAPSRASSNRRGRPC